MTTRNRRLRGLVLLLIATAVLTGWTLVQPAQLNVADIWMVRSAIEQAPELSMRAQSRLAGLDGTSLAERATRNAMKLAVLEGRMQDATALGDRLLTHQAQPDPITAHFLGAAYWEMGDKEKTRAILDAAGSLPTYLTQWALLGWQSFAAGAPDEAIAFFRRGIEYDPSWVEGHAALASYYWQTEAYTQATPYLEEIVKLLPPQDAQRLFAEARLALASGDVTAAQASFCQAWRTDAKSEYLHGCLWGLHQAGDHANALVVLRGAAPLFPEQVAAEARSWAEELAQPDQRSVAAQFLDLACSVSPAEGCSPTGDSPGN